MAGRCDRRAIPRALALAAVAAVTAARADAGPACDRAPTLSLVDVHHGLEPAPADHLGLDLRVRGLLFAWGAGCDVRRHAVEVSDAEAAEYGDDDRAVVRLGSYRHGWQAGPAGGYLGVRAAVRWGDRWRFATPVIGGSLAVGRALVRAELELGGLSIVAGDARIARRRTDLALAASAVWPAGAATRAEVRLRARDLAMPGGPDVDVHDLTLTAGLGLAAAARDGLRGLPGFVGVAARTGDRPATLLVLEWDLGVTAR
jgi:hypothetical protein